MNHEDTPLFMEPGADGTFWHIDWHAPKADHKANSLSGNVVSGDMCATNMCRQESGYMDLPFCEDCAWKMWSVMDAECPEYMKDAARNGRLDHARMRDARTRSEEAQREMNPPKLNLADDLRHGTIYYLRVGNLIKIGYTANMDQRMRQYPPNAELLAQHPGTMLTEKQIHNRLVVHLAKGREWFKPHEKVLKHIEGVKIQFPEVSAKEKREAMWAKNRAASRAPKPLSRKTVVP